MRIDAHQHFWRYNADRDRWITDQMAPLKNDFLPEQLIPELKANGLHGCIAVQTDQSEAETNFLLDLAGRYEAIHGVVGWLDLRADNVTQRLDWFSRYPKLCGFRHIAQSEPEGFLVREDFFRGIKLLGEHGFTYDILIYEMQLPAAIDLVARFPDQRFVLDHMAKPGVRENRYLPWARFIKLLAENPNVYCKISGLVTESDWKEWRPGDFKPYLDMVFESFGVERLMFGSDWPVCLLAAGYTQVVQLVADYMKDRPVADQDKIFGLNAAYFYGQRAAHRAPATRK